MARTKVFDPAQALGAAMDVFWTKGYEAASLDDLLSAMKIGRQSMYDTFGDKKQLYLAALDRYADTGREVLRERLSAGPSALGAIGAFLEDVARSDACQRERGCLAVNAVAEFGKADPDVHAFTERTQQMTERIFAKVLARARDAGELAGGLDLAAAAHFIHTAIRGMRISAKAGASAAQLSATAAFTMAALQAR
jgi:TetR/AcrR family transcriptional repressor of nem operon